MYVPSDGTASEDTHSFQRSPTVRERRKNIDSPRYRGVLPEVEFEELLEDGAVLELLCPDLLLRLGELFELERELACLIDLALELLLEFVAADELLDGC